MISLTICGCCANGDTVVVHSVALLLSTLGFCILALHASSSLLRPIFRRSFVVFVRLFLPPACTRALPLPSAQCTAATCASNIARCSNSASHATHANVCLDSACLSIRCSCVMLRHIVCINPICHACGAPKTLTVKVSRSVHSAKQIVQRYSVSTWHCAKWSRNSSAPSKAFVLDGQCRHCQLVLPSK